MFYVYFFSKGATCNNRYKMEKNIKEMINSYDFVSNKSRLSFKEAKLLYLEILDFDFFNVIEKREALINGTKYLVYDFIFNNEFLYLNNAYNDWDGIIDICNNILINRIESGILLRVKSFDEIFDRTFYLDFRNKLKMESSFDIKVDKDIFANLLYDFINLKKNNDKFDFSNFIEFVINDYRYNLVFYEYMFYDNWYYLYYLYDWIYHFSLINDGCLSNSKLDSLVLFLINNGSLEEKIDFSKLIKAIVKDKTIPDDSKNKLLNSMGLINIYGIEKKGIKSYVRRIKERKKDNKLVDTSEIVLS